MYGRAENIGAVAALDECADTIEFERLVHLIHDVTGWRDGPAFRGKLKAILGGADEDTASTWLRRLGGGYTGNGEWEMVIERLMVPETSFFRDVPQLDVLRWRVLPEIIERKRHDPNPAIRVWSAGCSSGEETYTLAMLVLDALVSAGQAEEAAAGVEVKPGWVVHIHGTDINPKMIEKARTGLYSDFALSPLRDAPAMFRQYLVKHDGGGAISRYGVRADVRSVTFFGVQNLKERPVGAHFDLVSCRNVLTYFDDAWKCHALDNIAQSVTSGGYLMLGATDACKLADFTPVEPRTSPILQKR